MITYDAVALDREQRRVLAKNSPITRCRDAVHAHAAKEGHPPLHWATSYFGLIAMTEDGSSPLSPFIIRYYIQTNLGDQDAKPTSV